MKIFPVPVLEDNYVWVITDENQRKALIVDPGESLPVSQCLDEQQLSLEGILITHHHWDHTNGISALKKQYQVPVFAPRKEPIKEVTNFLNEGDLVSIASFPSFQVIEIPGHTLGHVAFYAPGILFCGDTLFAAGCGRIFEGTAAQMFTSLQKIDNLPADTLIYCAHEYTLNNLRFAKLVEPENKQIVDRIQIVTGLRNKNQPSLPSVLADEKETNPFLRCHSPEIIASAEKQAGKQLQDPIEIFSVLRRWKDNFI